MYIQCVIDSRIFKRLGYGLNLYSIDTIQFIYKLINPFFNFYWDILLISLFMLDGNKIYDLNKIRRRKEFIPSFGKFRFKFDSHIFLFVNWNNFCLILNRERKRETIVAERSSVNGENNIFILPAVL